MPPERTDYEVSAEDYHAFVSGENAELAKPAPVAIVGEVTVKQYPAHSWSSNRWTLDTNVQQIANGLPQRKRLTITNHGTNPVYLSPTREQASITSGLLLPAGAAPFVMEHVDAVWAVAEAAKPTDISVYAEMRDGGPR